MNQNKQSGFVKWLLITISVLFLFVMLYDNVRFI